MILDPKRKKSWSSKDNLKSRLGALMRGRDVYDRMCDFFIERYSFATSIERFPLTFLAQTLIYTMCFIYDLLISSKGSIDFSSYFICLSKRTFKEKVTVAGWFWSTFFASKCLSRDWRCVAYPVGVQLIFFVLYPPENKNEALQLGVQLILLYFIRIPLLITETFFYFGGWSVVDGVPLIGSPNLLKEIWYIL